MDQNGFYQNVCCHHCGNELGKVHPAESYAGTYTGLCYSCQRISQFLHHTYSDGAKLYSYPPSQPSYRRDRESYKAYDDCEFCHGRGYKTHHQHFGNQYNAQCDACSYRFRSHTPRLAYTTAFERLSRIFYNAAKEEFLRQCIETGLTEKDGANFHYEKNKIVEILVTEKDSLADKKFREILERLRSRQMADLAMNIKMLNEKYPEIAGEKPEKHALLPSWY